MATINFTDVVGLEKDGKSISRINYVSSGEILWPTPSLPATYTRGNYLQQHLSDNRGALLSLPIGLNSNSQLEITLSFNTLGELEETRRNILGCYDDENLAVWGLQALNNQLYFNNELVPDFSLSTDTIYNIIISGNELRINNNLVLTSSTSPFEWNYMGFYDLILSDQSNLEDSWQADINIYKIRLKQNGVYTYDCIPATNLNTTYTGLYNLIVQTFYYDSRNPMMLTVETNS